jgi:hypothetical protein
MLILTAVQIASCVVFGDNTDTVTTDIGVMILVDSKKFDEADFLKRKTLFTSYLDYSRKKEPHFMSKACCAHNDGRYQWKMIVDPERPKMSYQVSFDDIEQAIAACRIADLR